MARRSRLMRNVRRKVEISTGAHFSRQHAHNGQSSPLPEAKRLQQLPLGMLEGKIDGVYVIHWQAATRRRCKHSASQKIIATEPVALTVRNEQWRGVFAELSS